MNDDLKKPSETNWARVEAMTDEEIDTSETPPLDETFFANAKMYLPAKRLPECRKVTLGKISFALFRDKLR